MSINNYQRLYDAPSPDGDYIGHFLLADKSGNASAVRLPVADVAGNFNVLAYGASPMSSAAVNTAAIQAAIDAAEVAGGCVYIPKGTYAIATGLTIAAGIILQGDGATTVLDGAGTTMDLITVTGAGHYAIIRDLMLSSSVTKTDGAGILLGSDAQVSGVRIQNVSIANCFNGIEINKAITYLIDGCTIYTSEGQTADAHISISNVGNPDGGDGTIRGCLFDGMGTVTAHIAYISGGGLKLTGNKFLGNGAATCIKLDFDSSPASGVFVISANSFQGMNTCGIDLDSSTGWISTIVSGNEFGSGCADMIRIRTVFVAGVSITGNTFTSTDAGTDAIDIAGVNGCVITGNSFLNFTTAIRVASSHDVVGLSIAGNNYYLLDPGYPLVDAWLKASSGLVSLKTPPAATGVTPGIAGELAWNADYIYVCSGGTTWKRVALATW